MTRVNLTKEARQKIIGRALAHRFDEKIGGLTTKRAALATAVYDDLYNPITQARMASLPSGWLPCISLIRVQFGCGHGSFVRLNFNGGGMYFRDFQTKYCESVYRLVLDKHQGGCAKNYDGVHPLTLAWLEAYQDGELLGDEIAEARAALVQVLARVRTVSALLKQWPEIEPFIEDLGEHQVPALRRSELNKMLGLPVEAEDEGS